jgi:hypothetical protein
VDLRRFARHSCRVHECGYLTGDFVFRQNSPSRSKRRQDRSGPITYVTIRDYLAAWVSHDATGHTGAGHRPVQCFKRPGAADQPVLRDIE